MDRRETRVIREVHESYNHWGRSPPARGISGQSRGRLITSGSDESSGPTSIGRFAHLPDLLLAFTAAVCTFCSLHPPSVTFLLRKPIKRIERSIELFGKLDSINFSLGNFKDGFREDESDSNRSVGAVMRNAVVEEQDFYTFV